MPIPVAAGSPVLRFTVRAQDTKADEAEVRRLLEEATKQAEDSARREHQVSAQLKVPGAFGGLGETVIAVHLLLPYLEPLLPYLKEAGKLVVDGVFTAAGEYFFNQYLAPELRIRNLLPSKLQVEPEGAAESQPPRKAAAGKAVPKSSKKSSSSKQATKKRRN